MQIYQIKNFEFVYLYVALYKMQKNGLRLSLTSCVPTPVIDKHVILWQICQV